MVRPSLGTCVISWPDVAAHASTGGPTETVTLPTTSAVAASAAGAKPNARRTARSASASRSVWVTAPKQVSDMSTRSSSTSASDRAFRKVQKISGEGRHAQAGDGHPAHVAIVLQALESDGSLCGVEPGQGKGGLSGRKDQGNIGTACVGAGRILDYGLDAGP